MSDDEKPTKVSGTGVWKLVPTLTQAKRDEFFRQIQRLVDGKEIDYLLNKTIHQYSEINELQRRTQGIELPTSGWECITGNKTGDEKTWRILAKGKAYKTAASEFSMNLESKLSERDQERIETIDNIPAQINALRKYYYRSTKASGRDKIIEFTNWKMNPTMTPEDNWNAMFKIRKEAQRHSKDTVFGKDLMWTFFVAGLRPKGTYTSITDGFGNNDASVDDKLMLLNDKWAEITPKTKSGTALKAISHHDRQDSDEEAYAAYGSQNCYKCGSNKHLAKECPYADRAFEYAKSLRMKD